MEVMFPLIPVGLILLLAGGGWFSGAITVGWICLITGLVTTIIPLLIWLLIAVGLITAGSRRPSRRGW